MIKKKFLKKKILAFLAIMMAMSVLSGCNRRERFYQIEPPSEPDPDVLVEQMAGVGETTNLTEGRTGGNYADDEEAAPTEDEIADLTGAGFDLFYNVIRSSDENSSILLSPVSIDFALGMTENGAAGNTLTQMEKVVNGGISSERLNPIMKYMSGRFQNTSEVSWNIANSLWLKNDGQIRMKGDFLDRCVGFYDAEVYFAPFSNQTLDDINAWTDKNTNGMIPAVLDTIDPMARLYLINAIAFEGEWAEQYEESQIWEDRDFTNSDGSTSKVNYLASVENRYFTLAGGRGFVKPYKGEEYSFVGILPEEGESCEEYVQKIWNNNLDFAEAVRYAENTEVRVRIPEFKADYDIELSGNYSYLGMTDAFSQNAANFENMLEWTSGETADVYIGKIIHKTFIDVDRKGTKAAAATVVEMRLKNAITPVEEVNIITLDRPFVYAIVDNETGFPIFVGCQNMME